MNKFINQIKKYPFLAKELINLGYLIITGLLSRNKLKKINLLFIVLQSLQAQYVFMSTMQDF